MFKNLSKQILYFGVVAIFCGFPHNAMAQSLNGSPIEVTISSPKVIYHIGENIIVTFKLINKSDNPILICNTHPESRGDKADNLMVLRKYGNLIVHIIFNPAWERNKDIIVQPNDSLEFKDIPINKDKTHKEFFSKLQEYRLRWVLDGRLFEIKKLSTPRITRKGDRIDGEMSLITKRPHSNYLEIKIID